MQNFSFFHESFNLRKLSSYLLNLQLSDIGICYVIADIIRNQYIAIKYQQFENPGLDIFENFQNAVKDDVYLNKHYKTVNFYLVNSKYTLVPTEFFDKKHLQEYFKYNQTLNSDEEIHFTNVKAANLYNVFAYPSVLTSFLVNHFPEVRLFHSTLPFTEYLLNLNENSNSTMENIGVNFYNSSFDILVMKNQEILLLNNFNFDSEEDAIFYILNIISKLSLDRTSIELILQGNISKQSKIYSYLKDMLPFTKFANKFSHDYPFKEVPPHFFSNLLIDF